MTYYGDIPAAHRELMGRLEKQEAHIDSHKTMPPARKAQAYVSIAHDWYGMHMEEIGVALIKKADKVCKDYTNTTMIQHMESNKDFSTLVSHLAHLIHQSKIDDSRKK